jgi:ribose transport system substrate-binding protein
MRARRSRGLSIITASIALAFGLSACGGGDSSSDSSAASSESGGSAAGKKVGYSALDSSSYSIVAQKLAVDALNGAGFDLLEPVSARYDITKQVSDIRNLVSAGAQGIVLVPTDSAGIKPSLDFLESKKIPAIALDVPPEQGNVDMIVRADNRDMGKRSCEQMGKLMQGKGNVLALQGSLVSIAGRDRAVGFTDCMKQDFPDIKVNEKFTDFDPEKAANIANTEVVNNKDLGGIYMASDNMMLAGVIGALQRAGRDAKVGEPGHVVLVSIDGIPYAHEQLKAGMLDAFYSQPLNLYAKYGTEFLKRAMEGETFKPGPTDGGTITELKGNPEFLVEAPEVTKENVDDPELWGNNVK